MTPGLLSARMQQEWVRGEMTGESTIFDGSGPASTGAAGTAGGGSGLTRLSPMCAMNTPRTRVRKGTFKRECAVMETAGEEGTVGRDENPSSGGGDVGKDESAAGGEQERDCKEWENELSNKMKESLLLPNDQASDNRAGVKGDIDICQMESIDVKETYVEEEKESNNRDSARGAGVEKDSEMNDGTNLLASFKPDRGTYLKLMQEVLDDSGEGDENKEGGASPSVDLQRSISITKMSSDEGVGVVELSCEQQGTGGGKWEGGNGTNKTHPLSRTDALDGPETDEEENLLLLDEIRKDVIRTHPDLRFFLEPKEDLGQKRYAALERILFVWAKLNKGVSIICCFPLFAVAFHVRLTMPRQSPTPLILNTLLSFNSHPARDVIQGPIRPGDERNCWHALLRSRSRFE